MNNIQFFTPRILDLPILIVVLLCGHAIINRVARKHALHGEKSLLIKLFYYHLAFSFIYCGYIFAFGGDSIGYWKPPTRFIRDDQSFLLLHAPGSSFVHFLTYFFAQILGLSLWGGTVVFSLIGFGGIVCLYLTLKRTLKANPTFFGVKLFPLVLFLPNMHFWSSGVGKDTVIFFALTYFIFCLTNLRGNVAGLGISFYLAFFIRPHIAFVMLIGFGCALFLSSKGVSIFWRMSFIVISVIVFFLIAPTVYTFIGVEEDSLDNYEDVANIRSQNLSRQTVGSSISLSSYSLPMKLFTFLYRPLFVDGNNLFGMVVSVENAFYLALTLMAFRLRTVLQFMSMPVFLKASFFIAGATTFFMSSSLSNLGIIIRQKNMVMFMIVLLSMYSLSEITYQKYAMAKRRRRVSPAPLVPKT